ncbi:MAG: transporter [Zoogloeaceae bacterium]|nr:transporter [Zoogloeaceae bacterium]
MRASSALCVFLAALPASAALAESSPPFTPGTPRVLVGTPPVNVNISSSGTLPEGLLFTALNASFAHKNHAENGSTGPDTDSAAWLLKIRYGLTNNLELCAIGSYIDLDRDFAPPGQQRQLKGIGDPAIGLSYAPFNIHQGDGFAWNILGAVIAPTSPTGDGRPPGNHAWGWRVSSGIGAFVLPNLRLDTELVATGPFERGGGQVKRGNTYQWNMQLRYLMGNMDIALESTFVRQKSGHKRLFPGNEIDLENGGTEWFIGPSMNFAPAFLAKEDIWFGIGAFFPVRQDFDGPNKSESVRYEFKMGKLW